MALFNQRVIAAALATAPAATPAQLALAAAWAQTVRDRSIFRQLESHLESEFNSRIVQGLLGYLPFGAGAPQTVQPKHAMGTGAVDLALGHFDETPSRIVAPFELKGADTRDLDAPMPGRKISPVQQAWNYANAVAGVRWVLVSNMLEIRLYGFGEGNLDYERFDLGRIDEPVELGRLLLLASAENLLGVRGGDLLKASKEADKSVSIQLYRDYKTLRDSLIAAVNAETGGADAVAAVSTAQKILDRVLFIAFAEDHGLLPAKTLEKAFSQRDPYNPRPIWETFKGLFRAIDQGNAALGIARYNGGLFLPDAKVDRLSLPDAVCARFRDIGAYGFETEVSVTVLGHIFEQSVADVEKLLARARGEPEEDKPSGVSGRRKRDGIVYTPDTIARFIVEKTLGAHLEDLFASSMAKYAQGDPRDYDALKFGPRGGQGEALRNELQAWYDYRLALKTLRVVDPACGSGVFLVAAFDFLKAEYDRVTKKIDSLRGASGQTDIEDIDREILSQNLYGVDVNEESVEITKLSLWLKTARKGKELDSLETIRVGDSLIEDHNFAYLKHGFSWNAAFPEVFAAGGFDVVLGNPPYVRMELIKPMKPYLEKRFEVVSDRADLYCYFYERGLRLLKPGGRLGYISSSTFFKTGSGAPLRRYLLQNASIDTVTDFGDLQIFEGVTTYPVILTLRRKPAPPDHALRFWKLDALPEGNFAAAFEAKAEPFPQAKLGSGSWELENPALRALREKIVSGKKTLKEIYGSPQRGIVTGLNEAFVVDRATRDRLIAEDPKSSELLKPFLEGKDLKRWRAEPRDLWLIYIPKNAIDIDRYPGIKAHLLPFKVALEKRATKQEWFELQQAQFAYLPGFESIKISYPHFSVQRLFHLEGTKSLSNDKSYFIPSDDCGLLAFLNSTVGWFLLTALAPPVRGGFYELRVQYVEMLPIPPWSQEQRLQLTDLSLSCQAAAALREKTERTFGRRIPDLCPLGREPKLTTKLHDWWTLPDFAGFRAEVGKVFKQDIPVKERSDWEDLFTTGKTEIARLSAEIKRHEAEIDAIVYRLFDLTPDELALLESSIAAR